MNSTEIYWARVKALPNPSRALRYYISLAGTEALDVRQGAWEALSDDEQALCRTISNAARNAVLAEEAHS